MVPAPDLQDGHSRLALRDLVTDARTDEQRHQDATTGEVPERTRTVARSRRQIEKLTRNDPALAEAMDSIGNDLIDQADRNPVLRVYLDGTFEWVRVARDGPVHPRTAIELARNDPELWWALQSLTDYAGAQTAIHTYADGSWEFYRIIRNWGPTPTGGDTLCGPTECDP